MLKKIILLSSIVSVLFISGCEILEDSANEAQKPKYILSLHEIIQYPRSKDLEQKIVAFDGTEYWINTNQFFHSRHIQEVKLVPSKTRKDYYDLLLKIDYSGIVKWIQFSMHFRHKQLALLVDGQFYSLYTPDQLADEDDKWVLLTGPFDKITAGGIQKYAHKNYIKFNPKEQSFMEMLNDF